MTDARLDELEEQFAPGDLADLEDIAEQSALLPGNEEQSQATDDGMEAPAAAGARARRGISKPAALKAIAKYVELAGAPDKHLELLATAIGTKAEPSELAAVIISTPRVTLGALSDAKAVVDAAEESAYAAMFAVFKLDREQLKHVWALLSAVGLVAGTLPVKESSAAVAVAEAAARVGDSERSLFDAVRDLARK